MISRLFPLIIVAFAFLYNYCNGASVAKPTCGGTSSSKVSHLFTPKNPPRVCVYHFKAYSKQVCQLRVDFAMSLAQPLLPGPDNNLTTVECIHDYLEVGQLRLCGIETKQHIYVPFNRTDGVTNVELSIVLATRPNSLNLPKPSWDIKVRQLECSIGTGSRTLGLSPYTPDLQQTERSGIKDGFLVAPAGCLQYFPQNEGVVVSFNYDRSQGTYPSNLNYAICFRRQTETQSLLLKATVFNLDTGNETKKDNMLVDSHCYSNHLHDYMIIPESTFKLSQSRQNERGTIFCGDSINGIVVKSTNPGPLMMIFRSGFNHKHDKVGFYFIYKLA